MTVLLLPRLVQEYCSWGQAKENRKRRKHSVLNEPIQLSLFQPTTIQMAHLCVIQAADTKWDMGSSLNESWPTNSLYQNPIYISADVSLFEGQKSLRSTDGVDCLGVIVMEPSIMEAQRRMVQTRK
eukprot:TRINITY_DN47675_c0_g1_i1.p1 TRINITY_DN47675_c0_g1~~TRINITY_DN47675_c0_g1_i1.p1  ORF type:complete len:126 (+),score=13.92 TRINITY_DN47675_c0_g1_i1:269-646(+)